MTVEVLVPSSQRQWREVQRPICWEGPTVAENIEMILRFHAVGGEDIPVVCNLFIDEQEALDAIASALDERRSLVLNQARYNREASEHGVIINLTNVVSVRVSKVDSTTSGQYL